MSDTGTGNYIGKPVYLPQSFWVANDPVLEPTQQAWDTTLMNYKIGDGKAKWSQLPYILVTPSDLSAAKIQLSSSIGALPNGKPLPVFIRTAKDQSDLMSAKLYPFIDYFAMQDTLTTFPLPTTAAEGDKFYILGGGKGGWTITQNGNSTTGQIIHGAVDSTRGSAGAVTSGYRYDTIRVACVVANTEFLVISKQGNPIFT